MKGTSNGGRSRAQLLAHPAMTERRLRRWRQRGLIEPPTRTHPGRPVGGSECRYDASVARSIEVVDEVMGRGRGRWQTAALRLFAEQLWVREDTLRAALGWAGDNLHAAMCAVAEAYRPPDGYQLSPGWDRANALAHALAGSGTPLVRNLRKRMSIHGSMLSEPVSSANLMETALTAIAAPVFGASSLIGPEDEDAIAALIGWQEPGATLDDADRAYFDEALVPNEIPFERFLEVSETAPLEIILSARDALVDVLAMLDAPEVVETVPAVAAISDYLNDPHAFALFVLQRLARDLTEPSVSP
jgi:hypothetical protein